MSNQWGLDIWTVTVRKDGAWRRMGFKSDEEALALELRDLFKRYGYDVSLSQQVIR